VADRHELLDQRLSLPTDAGRGSTGHADSAEPSYRRGLCPVVGQGGVHSAGASHTEGLSFAMDGDREWGLLASRSRACRRLAAVTCISLRIVLKECTARTLSRGGVAPASLRAGEPRTSRFPASSDYKCIV
jgi:hypothetical protein